MADELRLSRPFRLLRVEGIFEGSNAIPINLFDSPDDAMDAAARLPDQPAAAWKRDLADGVWSQMDRCGRGFVIHRMDSEDDFG